MAYYQNAPGKKKGKTDYASLGSWEEEGTRYSDAKKNRGGEHREDDRSGGRKYAAGRNSAFKKGTPGRRSGDEGGGGSGKRFSGERGKDFRRSPSSFRDDRRPENDIERRPRPGRPAAEEAPDYRSFEYRGDAEQPVREEAGGNILCGRNPIREALRAERDLEKLLVQKGELSGSAREIVQTARARKIMVQEVEKSRLDEIAPHHQGLIAFASAYRYAEVDEMLEEAEKRGEAPFLILLDGVTDPHNLGAMIRTAECVGAHGVIVPQHRSVGLTPAAVKAAAGAIEHIRVARVVNLNRTIGELQKKGIWVYAVTMDGKSYDKVNFKGPVALVIGAEGEGISRLTLEKCDLSVSLPMRGKLDSLNASVAAGVVMYRVLACRE